ncbi:MAG: hypothetical protein JWO67_6748 [Streptosporangiaceae bacterium]|nr:hypothetical protein [Streptosporangiaceae bacterium]
MVSPTPGGTRRAGAGDPGERTVGARRSTTETKASYKTTELYIYLVVAVAVLIASQLVDTSDGHNDYLRADRAWFYVVLLTIGYLISRGLAKAGSREPYNDR